MRAQTKEIFLAADKYNLQDLVVICVQELKESITPENVAEVLMLTNMIQTEASQSLRKSYVRIIKQNVTSTYKSVETVILADELFSDTNV